MQVRIWISFDLRENGDYQGMYVWLDNHQAVECGNNFASLFVECTDRGTVEEDVMAELKQHVHLVPSDRIYVVYRCEDNLTRGAFMYGHRKSSSPWAGCGTNNQSKA